MKKLEALEETLKLWTKMRDEDLICKSNTEFVNNCPCCHYVLKEHNPKLKNWDELMDNFNLLKHLDEFKSPCIHCPALPMWPLTDAGEFAPCMGHSATYGAWETLTDIMVDLIEPPEVLEAYRVTLRELTQEMVEGLTKLVEQERIECANVKK